ncbi:MAG: redoxin domain-containing protein [Planctomycetota bacterium]|jgi:tetratricopeptide (TPR) repeat protein
MMKVPYRVLLTSAVAVLALPAVSAQPERAVVKVGYKVPALQCTSVNEKALSWSQWETRAVVVLFYAEGKSYSTRGLQDIIAGLKGESELKERLALLVVTNGTADLDALRKTVAGAGIPASITVDPNRKHFRAYRVVAFPTAFFVSKDRVVAHIRKGYGPLFPTQAIAAAKLAAGMIDAAAFRAATSAQEPADGGSRHLVMRRTVRMAGQLAAGGMLDEARESLLDVLTPDSDSVAGVALLGKIYLLQKHVANAKVWIKRLEKIAPGTRQLRLLHARLHLQQGNAAGAEKELTGLVDRTGEVSLLRGRVLEATGRLKEAATLYRKALESLLEKAN